MDLYSLGGPNGPTAMGQRSPTEREILARQGYTLTLRVEQLERRVEELENERTAREACETSSWRHWLWAPVSIVVGFVLLFALLWVADRR